MKILALDTSSRHAAVALLLRESGIATVRLNDPTSHAAQLPLAVTHLLAEADWQMKDLDLLAVTIGPGSFTGLRIALGFAKGASLALGCPIVPLSTLAVLAAGTALEHGVVLAMMNGRQREVSGALFRLFPGAEPEPLTPIRSHRPEEWAALNHLAPPPRQPGELRQLTGEGVLTCGSHLSAWLDDGWSKADEGHHIPDPILLGRLGYYRFRRLGPEPSAQLEPFYLAG